MFTPNGKPLTEEQVKSLAAKKDLDNHYTQQVEVCLELIKTEGCLPSDVREIVQLLSKEALAFSKEPCINATTIGVVNISLKKQNPENKGMLEHLHWLAMDRVEVGKPLIAEGMFCETMSILMTSWTQAFLLAHNPEGFAEFNRNREEKLARALGMGFYRKQVYEATRDDRFFNRRASEPAALTKAKASFKDMNKPAPEGTVKELAARYGVSLSEIRRRKQEGTLHELS